MPEHQIILSTVAKRRTASTFPRNIALVLAAATRGRKGEVEISIRTIIIFDKLLPVSPDVKSDSRKCHSRWDVSKSISITPGHLEKFKVSLQNKEAPLCPCA